MAAVFFAGSGDGWGEFLFPFTHVRRAGFLRGIALYVMIFLRSGNLQTGGDL